jgi:hypothetical protein
MIKLQNFLSDDNNDVRQNRHIVGVSADFNLGTMGMLSSEVMSYNSNAWSTETFNLSYRQSNIKPYYLEASLERSIVDSLLAINNTILVDTYTFSADAPVANEFTQVGAAIYQSFTDDNAKQGGLIKFVYTPNRIEGLNTALVFKQVRSDQQGTGYPKHHLSRPV